MFETVVPETFAKRSKKIFYETLPVSLAVDAKTPPGLKRMARNGRSSQFRPLSAFGMMGPVASLPAR